MSKQTEVSITASVPQVVVDLVRVVHHRYSLLIESNQVGDKAKEIRAPILARARPLTGKLKDYAEQWGALTQDSKAEDFKSLAIKMAGERSAIKTIRTQAANATAEQTARVGVLRKSMKADDTAIMTKLGDSFIVSLIAPSSR
jgi:hypothetical protein